MCWIHFDLFAAPSPFALLHLPFSTAVDQALAFIVNRNNRKRHGDSISITTDVAVLCSDGRDEEERNPEVLHDHFTLMRSVVLQDVSIFRQIYCKLTAATIMTVIDLK